MREPHSSVRFRFVTSHNFPFTKIGLIPVYLKRRLN